MFAVQSNRPFPFVVLVMSALALCACQPTPEERFANAEAYMADGEYRSAVIELKNVLQAQPDFVAARRMLADASYILNDLGTADAEYRKVLSLTAGDAHTWSAYGLSLLAQGKASEALERAAPDLESFVDSDEAAAVLGDIYRALGNLSEAEGHYARALNLNPDNARGLVGTALTAAGGGDLQRAGELLDAALLKYPDSPFVLRSKGDVLAATQQFNEAAASYDRAIAAETASTPFADRYLARQKRISALIEAQQLDVAAKHLDEFSLMLPKHPQITFLRGRIALGQGDYDLAEELMSTYVAAVPIDPRGQAVLGAIKFSKNDLGQAEQYLSSAVRANIGGETTRLMLAETQLRMDRPQDAIESLIQAEGNSQLNPLSLAMLGRVKLGEGDTEAAIDYFKQSLELDESSQTVNLALASSYISSADYLAAIDVLLQLPAGPDGDYRREMLLMGAYLEQGNSADAEELGESLIRQNPDDANAHALVGVLYANLGQNTRARTQLGTGLDLDPANTGALYTLGILEVAEGNPDEAIDRFGNLLDVQPTYVPALIQLASALRTIGALSEIRPRLVAAREAAPESSRLLKLSSSVELMLGNTDAALEQINDGRRAFPDDPGFQYLDGMAQLQSGNLETAIAGLSSAARARPDNPTYQFDLARARLQIGDFAKAISAARAYRALRPADVKGLTIEVDAQIRSGVPAEAQEAVASYAERYPAENFVWMLFGDIARASGDAANAVKSYEKYAQFNWNRAVALRLAVSQEASGSDQSLETMQRWLRREPDDSSMRRTYAQLLEAHGNEQQAILEYERLAGSDSLDAIGLNNLAWHYMVQGRDGASDLAERAHSMLPDNGSITDTLGWILYQEGQIERAVKMLRQATEQQPTNPEIRYHLAVALAKVGEAGEARRIVDELITSDVEFPSRADAEILSRSL